PAGDPRETGRGLVLLGKAHWEDGAPERATNLLAEAAALLEPLGPSPELVQALTWSSNIHMLAGRVDEGVAVATAGLPMARALGIDSAVSHLLNTLGTCQAASGDSAGVALLHQALEWGGRSGDAEASGRAYTNLSWALLQF